MNRTGTLLPIILAMAMAAAVFSATGHTAHADVPRPRQVVIVITDGESVRQTENGADLVRSFIALLATLQNDKLLAFLSLDDPTDVLGPFMTNDPDIEGIQDQIQDRLAVRDTGAGGDYAGALRQAHAFLTSERAGAGSTVYVLTGGAHDEYLQSLAVRARLLAAPFEQMGWSINGISLSQATSGTRGFLDAIARNSGGRWFELSPVADGFQQIAQAMLSQEAKGSMTELGSRVLYTNELMTSVVGIVPGTQETTLLLFKDSPYGSLRLSNPSGYEASAGDRSASYVVEAPHVVVWRLTDPAPGNWRIDARGLEGHISAWATSWNGYSLVMRSSAPVPIGKPTSLMAYVQQRGSPITLEGVRLFANVTTPDGATSVHQMRDDGTEGDSVAGDGYFSMVLPPLTVQGSYEVRLELSWLDYNHRIYSQDSFEAKAFPSIDVRTAQVADLEPGERTKIATVSVHVRGQPYAVAPEELKSSISSSSSEGGVLEIEPRRVFGEGPAWEYDVYFTAQEGEHSAVGFTLTTEYAGRLYSHTTDAITLATVAPPAPSEPMASPPPPPVVAVSPPLAQAAPPALPGPPQAAGPSRTAVLAVAAAIALGLAAAAASVYVLTRTRPYGYLYSDRHEPLVDFSKVKRHPIWGVLLRNSVNGKDLNVPGLEGVAFQFTKARIMIRSLREHPTIRVNNQPLVGQASVNHRTWLGTRGKLYTFMMTPLPVEGTAGAD